MQEACIAPGIEHEMEFKVVAFGQTCWQCKLCGFWLDEAEDALAG